MLPDMVEIGSWIGLAAMTKSEITIKNVNWNQLGLFLILSESWEYNWREVGRHLHSCTGTL